MTMKEEFSKPCKDCKGIRRDGTGTCCLCGSRWMACKLSPWGEYLICHRCIKEKSKPYEVKK